MDLQRKPRTACWTYLQVAHEISENRRALLLQQVLQANDERNSVLYEGLLPNLWIKSWINVDNE